MGAIKRGVEFAVSANLVTETCCNCQMVFAMPADFKRRLLEGKTEKERSFTCPAGHPQHYTGEPEADKLRRERDRLQQGIEYQRQMREKAEADAKHQAAVARGYKGHATQLRKRAKAGTCPCCSRTFQQLARHMATQHPGFVPEMDTTAPEGRTIQ